MIIEKTISEPITYEIPPDGNKTPIIDPYDGCQFNCPYCFQLNDETWNKNIYAHINIDELLKDRLDSWDKTNTIYLGSRCDPYMKLEEKYCLTRKCLLILDELQINTMITTKSDNNLIIRDIDILKSFHAEITVLMGITNINQIKKGVQNNNIITANKLYDNGITVWGFITPVLPYIMDIESIISAINPNIPIFLDKLRFTGNTIQAKNMTKFIEQQYPEYTGDYYKIINENDENYYDELINRYSNSNRIKILF